jgi:hypothetical protein
MRTSWIATALLGSVLLAACGGGQPAETPEDTAAPVTDAAPPEPVSPEVDERAAVEPAPRADRPASPAKPSRPAAPAVREPAPAEPPREERPAPAPRVEYRQLSVPVGTALPLELLTPLSSETAEVETPVRARLKQAISVDGYPVLPVGTEFIGAVTEVAQAGRVKGRARVTFSFTEATIAGARETLQTDPITFEAEATKGEDAAKIGAGAGIGAVIGGILGGGSGAAKGAAIGGAAGTGAVLATKGQNVEVAAGADIAATLAEPIALRVRQ